MNLSTSNSNNGNATMTSRKIYGKAVLAISVCLFSAMSLIHITLEVSDVNKQGIMGRVNEAQAALPKIVNESDDLLIFFGSSMTTAGFSPRQFDQDIALQGKKIKSFNFGFGGLNPYFQDLLSRRIVDQFNANDRRLTLAMIEFNPFQTTKTRWNRSKPIVDSVITMLASDKDLVDILKSDLARGVHLFNLKYIRNNISPQMITTLYSKKVFSQKRLRQVKGDKTAQKEQKQFKKIIREQFKKDYPNYVKQEWSFAWQGSGAIPSERSAKTLEMIHKYDKATQTDAKKKKDRLRRIRNTDIEDLNFEPLLVEHFIKIIKNFQSVSDNVEVIMLPKNSEWIHNTDAGQKRLEQVVKQIELATGVTIKNHQDIAEITPDMFSDTTHLSRYRGGVAYTKYLVKQFSTLLL